MSLDEDIWLQHSFAAVNAPYISTVPSFLCTNNLLFFFFENYISNKIPIILFAWLAGSGYRLWGASLWWSYLDISISFRFEQFGFVSSLMDFILFMDYVGSSFLLHFKLVHLKDMAFYCQQVLECHLTRPPFLHWPVHLID